MVRLYYGMDIPSHDTLVTRQVVCESLVLESQTQLQNPQIAKISHKDKMDM